MRVALVQYLELCLLACAFVRCTNRTTRAGGKQASNMEQFSIYRRCHHTDRDRSQGTAGLLFELVQ